MSTGSTPQERLANVEKDARLRVLVCSIITAIALFLEFLLAVTLPAKAGMSTFLDFLRSPRTAVNPGFQLGLTVAVTLLGIAVCVVGILANAGKLSRLLLAGLDMQYVPLQLTLAVMNVICFVLWALVTEVYGWFGAGLAFTLIAIVGSFACALATTNVLMLPQYVGHVQKANVENRSPFTEKSQ